MADQKAKVPDNNRRLAALEASVSALAIALTANGFTIADGADPIEEAIKAIKFFAEMAAGGTGTAKLEELEQQRHNLAGYASATLGRIAPDLDLAPLTDEQPFAYLERLTLAANPRIDELIAAKGVNAELEAKLAAIGTPSTDAAELVELRKRVVALTAEVGELEQDLQDVTEAKNRLANQLADEGKGTGDATKPEDPEPEPAAEPVLDRPTSARDVGPEYGSLTEVAIGALVAEGGAFEVAFSNGEFELIEFAPSKLGPKDLTRVDSSRFMVEPAIHIRGFGARAKVAGAGLLYNGEQVAYCAFDPAIYVDPGQERRFHRALIFG